MNTESYYTTLSLPVGEFLLLKTTTGLSGLYHLSTDLLAKAQSEAVADSSLFAVEATQLQEYFAGKRKQFTFPLDLQGTEFQKKVWQGLLEIPYGVTISYGRLAHQIGMPKAVRAVGTANGKNPVSIIVPCHRVVAATGGIGGYVWGTNMKQQLLELEKKHA